MIYLVKGDEVLLALKKRGFGEGNWNGAGGKVELNESIENAMIRETKEEIGVTPTEFEKVGYLVFNEIHNDERKIMKLHVYICREWKGDPSESEEMKPQWYKFKDLPLKKMWDADKYWLPQILTGDKLTGEFTLGDNNKVLEFAVREVKHIAQERNNKFAVFDIDGTLIRWQLYHAVVDKLASAGVLGAGAKEELKTARMRWKKREHPESFREYERFLIDRYEITLPSIDAKTFDVVVRAVIDEYKDQVYIYTRQLINDLKAKGYTLLAISGSHQELVEAIAAHYGFDDFLGSHYERVGDRFSGKKDIVSLDKKKALKSLIKKHNLDIQGSIAVGDSLSDAIMLEMVGNPIAFNPDNSLYEKAKVNSWKIVIERKNVVYELEPKNGKYVLA